MSRKFFVTLALIFVFTSAACAAPFVMPMAGNDSKAPAEAPKAETPKPETPKAEAPKKVAVEEKSIDADTIAEVINNFLVDDDWKFDYDGDKKRFNFNMTIEGKLQRIRYYIYVREDCYTVYAIAPLNADKNDPQVMAKTAEFLSRANYGLRNGNFELDFDDGEVRYKTFVNCDGVLPSHAIIEDSIIIPSMMFERYSSGILDMMFGSSTPKDAIEKCEEK